MKTWQLLKKNPELFQRYFIKEYTIKAIRKFFEDRDYHELESPILTDALPQERYLDVLHTDIKLADGSSKRAYLIPSTETWNKKILAAGLGNHFVVTKVFRGLEEMSPNHSPEFTMLEWYQTGDNYFDLMDTTEELVRYIKLFIDEKTKTEKLKKQPFDTSLTSFGTTQGDKNQNPSELITQNTELKTVYQGQTIDLGIRWDRFSVRELLMQHCNIKLEDIQVLEKFREIASDRGHAIREQDDWQTIFEILFSSEIEPKFAKDKPTFVYDFPRILCPLTKVKEGDDLVSAKVELYIAGKEIANGYTELLDWQEQERRFKEEQKARAELGKEEIKYDQGLVEALKEGMPPVAGIGLGLDRLVMILADAKSISDINYFPASEWE